MDSSAPPPKELIELMRDPHQIELFEDFRARFANDLHAGFRQRAPYDDQRAVLRPLQSASLDAALSEAMQRTDLIADLRYKPQGCGWEDVLNCIDRAKASYDEKGKSSKVRAWSRNAVTTADVLKSLAGLIPDEKGLSVLRQGLVIIFQAWQTRIRNKEEILKQLEDLPMLLSTATERWKVYPGNEGLKNAIHDLCETVVNSIGELIRILLRKQHGSLFAKTMHRIPNDESQRIDEISNTVTKAKATLEACVTRLQHERQAKIYETSTASLSEIKATREAVHGQFGIMMGAIMDIGARQSESKSQNDKVMKDLVKEEVRQALESLIQARLYGMVGETEYHRRLGCCTNSGPPTSENPKNLLISKEDLLQHFRLSELGSVAEDVERIRQQGTNVASEGRELARKITTMTQFTEWVSTDESRFVMVDGHCKSLGNGKTSPLTVLCASLASTFDEAESLVILQYYCGHHGLDMNGLPAGPLGLIQSLLAQLLRKPNDVLPEDLDFDKELYERASPHDVDNLCEVFGAVFSQIVENKITLCIIDEIAEFEGDEWRNDMGLIAHQLRWMVHRFQGPQRLKVLMASANKSAVVSDILDDDDKISFRGSGLPNHSPRRLVMSRDFSFS